ncbi:MAG: hypothetical protein CBC42_05955 [Betaproteobacteria bacterium TMED82]|nr:MAG: hypothetical protein CBC42_05955 [Betaproteobacteria bacterium TMED82]|tara:strand:+ start:37739 stop:38845 length:1107 start_codon:yes stop_codon:yes gene_type:complete
MKHKETDLSEEDILEQFEELSDTSQYRRYALWFLVFFFGGTLLWAALVPLEEGVPTIGSVVVETKRKAIQHQSGGVIKEIYVKEGDFVEKDQKLLKLSDSTAKNEVEIEKNNIQSLNESINSQFTLLKKIDEARSGKSLQISLLNEELFGIRNLVKDGYAPKVRQLALERELAELESNNRELKNTKLQTEQKISEQKYQLEAAKKRLLIVKSRLDGKVIKASVSGQIVGLQKQAVGSVISPAEKIMDLVPRDEKLLVETEVMPNLIDRVEVGDIVDIRFTSFSLTPFLVVPGKISSISTDILNKPRQKVSTYYLARVVLTEEAKTILGKRKIRPGMQVEIVIKTGTRTLLAYMLHPLTRRIAHSMKEE